MPIIDKITSDDTRIVDEAKGRQMRAKHANSTSVHETATTHIHNTNTHSYNTSKTNFLERADSNS